MTDEPREPVLVVTGLRCEDDGEGLIRCMIEAMHEREVEAGSAYTGWLARMERELHREVLEDESE
jgi:hypothetical protein